ncbi:MAG: ATP-binding protein, partial [Olsenella sp.]
MSGEGSDLVSFVASMGGERQLRVEENLGEGYVRLRVAEAERRQAKHDIRCVEDVVIEMLRNARDAGARHIYVATTRVGNLRTTTMLDDGSGIPADMQSKIFEARVTSKLESVRMDRWGVHGRGMALYSVKENSVSAEV